MRRTFPESLERGAVQPHSIRAPISASCDLGRAAAKRAAVTRPMPAEAPVTSTTASVNCMTSMISVGRARREWIGRGLRCLPGRAGAYSTRSPTRRHRPRSALPISRWTPARRGRGERARRTRGSPTRSWRRLDRGHRSDLECRRLGADPAQVRQPTGQPRPAAHQTTHQPFNAGRIPQRCDV